MRIPRPGAVSDPGSAFLLLVLFLALRLPFLANDLPASLGAHYHDVASPLYDEGWWTANARQHAQSGRWTGTGLDLVWVSPVFTVLMAAAFGAGGLSLTTARLASVVPGALGLVFLLRIGATGRGADRTRTRATAGLLLATSFAAAHGGRLALPEALGTALGLAGAWRLRRGTGGRFIAGALAALAMLTKPHFVFLIPTLVTAAAVLAARDGRSPLGAAVQVIAGAALPLAAWLGVVAAHAAPVREILAFYDMGRWILRAPSDVAPGVAAIKPAIQTVVVGVVYRHPLLVHLPGLFLLAALAWPAAVTAAHPRRTDPQRRPFAPEVPDAVVIFALWALFGSLFVGVLPYQAFRYFEPLFPAWAYLAAWFLTAHAPADPATTRSGRFGALLRTAIVAILAAQLLFAVLLPAVAPGLIARAGQGDLDPLHPSELRLTPFLIDLARARSLDAFATLHRQEAYFAALVLVGALAVAGASLAAWPLSRYLAPSFRPGGLPPGSARIVLALVLGWQAVLWGAWIPRRTTALRDMGRDLARRLDEAAIVSPAGTWSLENHLVYDSSAVRRHEPYDASGGATHFLALESHPLLGRLRPGGVERAYPGTAHVASYVLGDAVIGLYRAPARPGREKP